MGGLVLALAVALLPSGCGEERSFLDAGDLRDGSRDAGHPDAPSEVPDSNWNLDSRMAGVVEGGINLEGGGPPPPGRVRCYFGKTYDCTRDGEECCISRDHCYFPATEPEACPDG